MRSAGACLRIRSVGRVFCRAICFCLGAVLRGALLGLPVCFAGCVWFGEMVEYGGRVVQVVVSWAEPLLSRVRSSSSRR